MPDKDSVYKKFFASWRGSSEQITLQLLAWYKHHARPFPWRKSYTPYNIWISEMMLQQTQAERGQGYYKRWMRRFPDLQSVANATENEVLNLWQGLGYYTRARNILKTARIIQKDYNGIFPADCSRLLTLPGIGPYTAHALLSIAYNLPYCVIDGNVIRVLSRLLDISFTVDSQSFRTALEDFLMEMMQEFSPRNFNQALMELGALVCTPRKPLCNNCPVQHSCSSYKLGTVLSRPVKKQPPKITQLHSTAGIILHENRYMMKKFPDKGLFANLWGFPSAKSIQKQISSEELTAMLYKEHNIGALSPEKILSFKHSYTRYRITMHVYLCHLPKKPVMKKENIQWLKLSDIQNLPLPSAHNRIYQFLLKRDCST